MRTVTERLTDTGGYRKRARERERDVVWLRQKHIPTQFKPYQAILHAAQCCTSLYSATAGASGGSVKSGIEALGVPATHVAVLTPQAACIA